MARGASIASQVTTFTGEGELAPQAVEAGGSRYRTVTAKGRGTAATKPRRFLKALLSGASRREGHRCQGLWRGNGTLNSARHGWCDD